MDAAPLPAVTGEWLTRALGTPVDVVAVHEIGAGFGLLGSLSRVRTADGRSLIVKRPSPDPGNRAIAEHLGYYAREAGTYAQLLPRRGVTTPRCLAVVDQAHGPALVLEDLWWYRPGDQLAGASPAQLHAAVELAARIHAAFWNAPELAASSWLPGPDDPVVAGYRQLLATTWDAFCARIAPRVPAEHLDAAERAATGFDAVLAGFAAAPRTLVHGDFRLDNLLFDDRGEAAVVDWQLAQWGRGPYDLAFLLAGSAEPAVRRAHERALVKRYHATLTRAGVTGYDLEHCWRDYRRGHVMNLPNPVTALVAVSGRTARGDALLETNARRALAAVADHAASVSSW